MMTVTVNNEPHQIPPATVLADFLANYCAAGQQFAVAINGEFVPRSRYPEQQLNAGDFLDVVSPVGGG